MPPESPRPALPSPDPPRGEFLLVACQPGAEAALAARQEAVLPDLRRGAWRRGVVTFRTAPGRPPEPAAVLSALVFGRACIHSLGQVSGPSPAALADRAAALAGPAAWRGVHVWDRAGTTADTKELHQALVGRVGGAAGGPVRPGDLVLDCVRDAVDRAWVGWHRVDAAAAAWPGGLYPVPLPPHAVSRAWLKLDEAIASFGLELRRGERAVEIGCAPGGASQRLLEAGLHVVGVDPALVEPAVATHGRFTQWRRRARDVRLKDFRPFDWIVADMNIDPSSTMEAVERIVAAPGVRPRGIVATLKLPTWARAAELEGWLERFRARGFAPRARQLSTGGREVCVLALRGRVSRRTRPAARRRRVR